MDAISKILVVIDPTQKEQPALARAGELARAAGAAMHLFLCDYNQGLSGDMFFDDARLRKSRASFLEHRGEWLDKLAAPWRDAGVAVTTEVVWNRYWYSAVVEATGREEPDMVVKETQHHATLKRVLLSSSDWSLIRECPATVLLVRAGDWARPPVFLAAVDPFHEHDKPADLDDRIIGEATRMTRLFDGQLRLVHAWRPIMPMALGPMPVTVAEGIDNDELFEHRKAGVEKLAAKHGIDADDVLLGEGDMKQVLPTLVEECGASMVVMGAVARGRLERVFIGSTAERVLDKLACDLLLVRP